MTPRRVRRRRSRAFLSILVIGAVAFVVFFGAVFVQAALSDAASERNAELESHVRLAIGGARAYVATHVARLNRDAAVTPFEGVTLTRRAGDSVECEVVVRLGDRMVRRSVMLPLPGAAD